MVACFRCYLEIQLMEKIQKINMLIWKGILSPEYLFSQFNV